MGREMPEAHVGHGGNALETARHPGNEMPEGHAMPEGHGGHTGHGADTGRHAGHSTADFARRFWVSIALTIPILLLSPTVRSALHLQALEFTGDKYVLFGLSTVVFFYGGMPFLKGIVRELRARKPGMMTLIAVAITVAYAYSTAVTFGLTGKPDMVLFWELATLIDIMLLGHWLEMRSIAGASRALEKLIELLPAEAHLLDGDETRDVEISSLVPGDRVLIRPGEKVPVDGTVLAGETTVDESLLTGESAPVLKVVGSEVTGGSLNSEGAVEVEVKKTGADTYLSQVAELIRSAQQSRSRSQALADKAAVWLTAIALTAGATTLVYWLASGRSADFAIERTVAVMVIACPHALGLAIPLVVAVSTALAATKGLLIRERTAFERARNVTAVVFDKTGTLTEGRFGVRDVSPTADDLSQERLLELAASVEAKSEHSIARGIVAEATARGLRVAPVTDFRAIPGSGAVARLEGRQIMVVRAGYLEAAGGAANDDREADTGERPPAVSEGLTVVDVLEEGRLLGSIALADIVRPESRSAIDALKDKGIRCMMLTGDNRHVARGVAEELGLDDYFAEVLPREKSERIREVKERGLVVAMVGDGVNDAPALVEADVGIAIGAGTEVAVESADIVLARNDPRDIVTIIDLARSTNRKMVQNLAWATGYNAFAIPAAAGVFISLGIVLTPALGAILMSASTVIVAVNSKLLRLR